ncbi:MAG: type IV secretory system conjugative DNA transfer family protein [Peptostreptococcaceae bacterium]|nr:type IV secretory system conjugative DNA transfer family protein [Peptostreptococcaceae bacterium]
MPLIIKNDYDIKICKNKKNSSWEYIRYNDRFLHTNIIGATGTGKTSSLIIPIIYQDLLSYKNNLIKLETIVFKMAKENKITFNKNFDIKKFNIKNIKVKNEFKNEYKSKIKNLKFMGMTIIAPDMSLINDVYKICMDLDLDIQILNAKDINLDSRYEYYYNPFDIKLDDIKSYKDKIIKTSNLFADIMLFSFESNGQIDPYFSSVNRLLITNISILVMLAQAKLNKYYKKKYSIKKANILIIRNLINDFSKINEYFIDFKKIIIKESILKTNFSKLFDLYTYDDSKIENLKDININNIKIKGIFESIFDILENKFKIKKDKNNQIIESELEKHSQGLKNQLNNFLLDTNIQRVLCGNSNILKSINLDDNIDQGKITLFNFELGDLGAINSTMLGMFFLNSLDQSILSRDINKKNQFPHHQIIDEFPLLCNENSTKGFTLYRKFNCAITIAMQNLSQMEKTKNMTYLKNIILSNCSHHIVFGRGTIDDSSLYSKMSFMKKNKIESTQISKDSILNYDPSLKIAKKIEISLENEFNYENIRNSKFQEIIFYTVKNNSLRKPIKGLVFFLSKNNYKKLLKSNINWRLVFKPNYSSKYNLNKLNIINNKFRYIKNRYIKLKNTTNDLNEIYFDDI